MIIANLPASIPDDNATHVVAFTEKGKNYFWSTEKSSTSATHICVVLRQRNKKAFHFPASLLFITNDDEKEVMK